MRMYPAFLRDFSFGKHISKKAGSIRECAETLTWLKLYSTQLTIQFLERDQLQELYKKAEFHREPREVSLHRFP